MKRTLILIVFSIMVLFTSSCWGDTVEINSHKGHIIIDIEELRNSTRYIIINPENGQYHEMTLKSRYAVVFEIGDTL